jgi:hypothetical protein
MTQYDTHRGAFGVAAGWTIAVVVLALALGISLWAFGVFTSDIKGAGDAIKQKNRAVNRIQKQEQFEQIAADFDGYRAKIPVAVEAVKAAASTAATTDDELRLTELLGLRQTCIDAAQQFNAESRKYTSRDWKSAGLPERLDPIACQEG